MTAATRFEVAERPTKKRAFRDTSLMGALRKTAETGKAVRIPGKAINGGYRTECRGQGFKLRTQVDGDTILLWCERITPNGGHGAPASAERSEDASQGAATAAYPREERQR